MTLLTSRVLVPHEASSKESWHIEMTLTIWDQSSGYLIVLCNILSNWMEDVTCCT